VTRDDDVSVVVAAEVEDVSGAMMIVVVPLGLPLAANLLMMAKVVA